MKVFSLFNKIKKTVPVFTLLIFSSNAIYAQPTSPAEVDIAPLESDSNHINYYLLQLNHVIGTDATVDYITRDGTAKAGEDYVAKSGTARINAGYKNTVISIEIIADSIIEDNEYFDLVISNPNGANFPIGTTEIAIPRVIIDDDLIKLPRITVDELKYIGGFRIPGGTYGESRTGYSDATIAYNKDAHSIFLTGFNLDSAIAEFPIPELVNSNNLLDLKIGNSPIQNFSTVLTRSDTGNIQSVDRIGAMEYINGELLVQNYQYYDALVDNTHTSLVVRNANDLANSNIDGFFEFDANAHGVFWVSPVPPNYQSLFNADYLVGGSSSVPINGRLSMGPSAFMFHASDIINTSNTNGIIETLKVLDFSLEHILSETEIGWLSFSDWGGSIQYNYAGDLLAGDAYAESYNAELVGNNQLWTEGSSAYYGLIIPGTRTYAVFGDSTMHDSGGGYKITQKDGHECGGPCAYDPSDRYNYFWFFDVMDLYQVRNGNMKAYEVKPYDYGKFEVPFENMYDQARAENYKSFIHGGTFNAEEGIIYFSLPTADREQSFYEPPPIIIAYKVELLN